MRDIRPLAWEEPRAEVPEGRVDQPKTSSEEADSLQREVEFEMIMFLREQNSRLIDGQGSGAVEREGDIDGDSINYAREDGRSNGARTCSTTSGNSKKRGDDVHTNVSVADGAVHSK